jgi:hypothetical protein
MAKKKTGKKIPHDRPSPRHGDEPLTVPSDRSSESVPPSAPAPKEERPVAPSTKVVAESPEAVITAAASSPPASTPPADPSTPPVVKDVDDAAPGNTSEADASEEQKPAEKAAAPEAVLPPASASKIAAAAAPSSASKIAVAPTSTEAAATDEAPPSSVSRGSQHEPETVEAPPSAPGSGSTDEKISGRALLDERLVPKSTRGTKTKKGSKTKTKPAVDGETDSGTASSQPDDFTDEGHDDFFAVAPEKVHQKHFVAETFEEDDTHFRPLSADDVARRDKLRRIVTIVVACAAAACLFVGVRLSMGTKHADPPPLDASQVVIAAPPTPKPQPVPDEPATPPPAAATTTAEAPAASASVSAAASASAIPALSASAAPALSASAAPGAVDPEEAKKLAKNALRALEGGNNKEAVEKSSAAVDADPSDATGYLYWGTALMNMGKLGEAKKIFATCVEKATRGPKGDCKQFR